MKAPPVQDDSLNAAPPAPASAPEARAKAEAERAAAEAKAKAEAERAAAEAAARVAAPVQVISSHEAATPTEPADLLRLDAADDDKTGVDEAPAGKGPARNEPAGKRDRKSVV